MASRKNRSGKANRRSPKAASGAADRLRLSWTAAGAWIEAHRWHSIAFGVVLLFTASLMAGYWLAGRLDMKDSDRLARELGVALTRKYFGKGQYHPLAGVPVRRLIVAAGLLGGGCAGLAGMAEVAAVHGTANASLIAGYGYSGILVAFLARHHPLAIIPVALLLGGFLFAR